MIIITTLCNIRCCTTYLKKRIDKGTTYSFPPKYLTHATIWKTTYRIESTINSNERTNSNIVAIMIAASLLTTYMKIQVPYIYQQQSSKLNKK